MPPSLQAAAPRWALRAARPVRVAVSRSGFWGVARLGGSCVVFGCRRPGNRESRRVKIAPPPPPRACVASAFLQPSRQSRSSSQCPRGRKPFVSPRISGPEWSIPFSGPRFPHNDVFSYERWSRRRTVEGGSEGKNDRDRGGRRRPVSSCSFRDPLESHPE
ncbi:tigger transposable element derived 7 [Rhinolophus ferrumequinum]|uniref:Tigger transposable element derived 7 n=1 Tax=Rhinolophus ferrumequinum TaxID=59479 RepID=A0A7J7R6P1_RHIFE|nr:tigger transposable element derived 7 [Rhinolophus ferrumequinum]